MKKNEIITYVVVFIVAIALGFVIYNKFFTKNNETPSPTPNPTVNPTEEPGVEPTEEPTVPTNEPVASQELVIADAVKVSTNNLVLARGESKTFTITVSGAAGVIEVNPSNGSLVTVSTTSGDCNESKCFYDAPTGSESSIDYTITGVDVGDATVDIVIADVLTYDEVPVTGSGSVNVTVE